MTGLLFMYPHALLNDKVGMSAFDFDVINCGGHWTFALCPVDTTAILPKVDLVKPYKKSLLLYLFNTVSKQLPSSF
jgi:hypothetical protein